VHLALGPWHREWFVSGWAMSWRLFSRVCHLIGNNAVCKAAFCSIFAVPQLTAVVCYFRRFLSDAEAVLERLTSLPRTPTIDGR
jgi:hypothetical protein